MRLLNVRTREFEIVYDPIPEYAILSHTWGDDEVTFDDMRNGYSGESVKIEGCCEQAAKDGLRYVWIDTICIDKSSSSELTEAINSMFAWYRDSTVCYAYLTDVPSSDNPNLPGSDFRRSRWFTRGWTLQELLAPEVIQFFSGTWDRIGEKLSQVGPIRDFMQTIEEITGIPKNCLSANWAAFEGASVAQKMSWAAGRRTTRKEDRAYSLLGIFGVHMPMLYGEGDNAFVRLQEEIMRTSDDRTILAWGYGITSDARESVRRRWNKGNLFAASPDDFQHSGDIMPKKRRRTKRTHFTMTNRGLQIELLATKLLQSPGTVMVDLECCSTSLAVNSHTIALVLVRSSEFDEDDDDDEDEDDGDATYSRIDGAGPAMVPKDFFRFLSSTSIYIGRKHLNPRLVPFCDPKIRVIDRLSDFGYAPVMVYPHYWGSIVSDSRTPVLISRRPYYVYGEKIFVLYQCEGKPSLVAKLDYKFDLDENPRLRPGDLDCSLSLVSAEPLQTILGMFGPSLGEIQRSAEWYLDLDKWTWVEWTGSVQIESNWIQVGKTAETSEESLLHGWQVELSIRK